MGVEVPFRGSRSTALRSAVLRRWAQDRCRSLTRIGRMCGTVLRSTCISSQSPSHAAGLLAVSPVFLGLLLAVALVPSCLDSPSRLSLSLYFFNFFVSDTASLRCLMGSLTSALSVRKQPDGALVSGSSRLPASDTAKTPRPQICTSKLRDRGTRATTSFHPSAHDTHPHTHPQWYAHNLVTRAWRNVKR